MFQFKMQTVLDVRKTLEEKATSELSTQKKELQQETENLQTLQQQKEELIDSLRNMQNKKVKVSEIMQRSAGIDICRQEESLQHEKVQTITEKVDRKREEVLEASKKKKVMEICKTRHFDQYQSEQRAHERTAIDEIVIAAHNRNTQE
jgi:flagellar FliJ protein